MYVPATQGVDKLLRPLSKDGDRRPSRRAASSDPEPASEDAELPAEADDGEPLGYTRVVAEPAMTHDASSIKGDAASRWDVVDVPEARASNAAVEPAASANGSAFYDLLEQAARG